MRSTRALVLTLGLALSLGTPSALASDLTRPGTPGSAGTSSPSGTPSASGSGAPGSLDPGQTSDGQRGQLAPRVPTYTNVRRTTLAERWVRPGVLYTQFEQTDRRGKIRAHLLTIDYKTRGLKLDYTSTPKVPQTAPVTEALRRNRAVAGVNGDFFDIGRSGAPLGLGVDRQRRLVHGRTSGWNASFWIGRKGMPMIGELPVRIRMWRHPELAIDTFNSPEVPSDKIGLYNGEWGRSPGWRVTAGDRFVRSVLVRNGRVVWNRGGQLPRRQRLDNDGWLLVARGASAPQLKSLKRGTRARFGAWVPGAPQMAITGNRFILQGGVSQVVDDREMHPRTAIGIDRDAKKLLLLVVDGRSSSSRGYTMVELAKIFTDLGAEDALNLDGGGSSTMAVRGPGGRLRVANSPSDGSVRSVPNGIEITYRQP